MDEAVEPANILRLAQKRFSHLIGSLPIGIIVASSDGLIESANRTTVELFGYSEYELVGKHLRRLFSPAPWGSDDKFGEWCHAQGQSPVEVRGVDANDEIIPLDFGVRLFDQSRTDRMLVILQDVTDRFVADQLKRNFFQMVNHDVRSPLTNISMFLKSLESGVEFGSLTPLGLDRAKSASKNLQRILTLTDDLLQLQNLESSLSTLDKVTVSIPDLVANAVSSVSQASGAKSLEVAIVVDAEHVCGDMRRLEQVLINLLTNAIGHTPEGLNLFVTVKRRDGKIRFSVHDSGPGVPDGEKDSIFERFSQGKSKGSGSYGLGLAICKEIIRQHCGIIGCNNSEIAKGSEFWFDLADLAT